jgi:hypothetical protein
MTGPTDAIEVSGPARPETVGLLRAVAATLAARLGMDIAEIEELRVVVDEASTLLLGAGPARLLTMRLSMPAESALAIVVRTDAEVETLLVDEGASWPWRVIRQLTTEARAEVDGAGPMVAFSVRRGQPG